MIATLFVCLLALPAFDPAIYLESFDKVWSTVKQRHYDPNLKGVDWQQARTELRPKMETAKSKDEARGILTSLLGRLGESHFAIIPAEAYDAADANATAHNAEAGFDIRLLEGDQFVVTRVLSGSPADAAGIRTGWTLRELDGKPLASLLPRGRLRAEYAVLGRLRGSAGEIRNLRFAEREVKLTLADPKTGRVVRFGHLPPIHVSVVGRVLADGIGYLSLSAFCDPDSIQRTANRLIGECGQCRGIVVDLRGNPGGMAILAATVTGWFTEQPVVLGTLTSSGMTLKLTATPRPTTFQGPVAVLQDEHSMSTSEFLAGGWQDLKRARIFGQNSAGAALPSVIERLPSGDGFQFVTASYVSNGGKPLEGTGVKPDEFVRPTREGLLAGRDEALEAAIRWLSSTTKKGAVSK